MSMAAELRRYQSQVEEAMSRALATGKPEVFENEGPEHARIVLDTMLEHAKSSLDVVASSMDKRVWSQVQLQRLVERISNGHIRVMLPKFSDRVPENSALYGLVPHPQIEVRRLPLDMDAHFAVVDQSHVRFEFDCATRTASVSFGNPDSGLTLTNVFERLWKLARQKDLSPTLFDVLA